MTAARDLLRPRTDNPWHALWALLVGFFMILLDATIVSVANPSIMDALHADYDAVIWVTSAYLLAYAVPLLLAGRLGDRFGPRNLYLVGLATFTAASLWCGLAGSIEVLVAARVVQGVGAALLTPQTLSTITRVFPPERRGVALSVWGATAGVATLVGPLAGGVLVDGLGWQWIFIVNVPIGVLGLVLALIFVPVLPTEKHGYDVIGVLLSGVALFLIVFALQEGQSHQWAPWIWATLVAGVVAMGAFVYWQAVHTGEPLIPLRIFRDNDFSLSNLGIAVIGFAVTAMIVPVMFYAQAVCGLSPTRSALLTAPMAIASGVLAPFVGKLVDRTHPRPLIGFGFSAVAIALTWLSFEMTPTTPIWRLELPLTLMGVGMAFIWSPLAATATRNLPPRLAGAGSGVYNTTRQVGSVLGSAGIAALMTAQISAAMPAQANPGVGQQSAVTQLPAFLHAPFAEALSRSLLLPAFVALFGVIAALFLRGFGDGAALDRPSTPAVPVEPDYFADDDDYVEYTVDWSSAEDDDGGWDDPDRAVRRHADVFARDATPADDSVTSPLAVPVGHPLPAPADTWHAGPADTWHSLMDDEPLGDLDDRLDDHLDDVDHDPDTVPELIGLSEPYRTPEPIPARNGHAPWRDLLDDPLDVSIPVPPAEPIGLGRNGFHVADEVWPAPSPGRHSRRDDQPADDAGTYGKHSMRFRD
ncbi:DHA2 family efflux MFS transporter permease subunit [Mycolicibacterium sp. P1-18]|uniref:MFS transporter n=1 Tax=Mycolicibacterium sp. P1-18 TaxID=2024615 RepID=UPI0011F100C8|nr:MFS transporter [Mycolicibacterium sp. P1-18]KAA0095258.1 DHA2 family efflux MFS transporter permease subunit [Mycolicibacterium sp. P1-18]